MQASNFVHFLFCTCGELYVATTLLIIVQPLQEVGRAAAAHYYIFISLRIELKFKSCAEVLRYVFDRINRYDAASRDAEEYLRVEHLLYRVE